MTEPIVLTADDPILKSLNFKPYRNMTQRRVVPFSPADDEPQTLEVATPWGAKLTAKKGDLLVSELNAPDDAWPVDAQIFDETYLMVNPGYCIKRTLTWLVELTEITGGDEERTVIVHSLEGVETVKAGDFFLAKGVKGEIWAFPKGKVVESLKPAE